MGYRLAGSEYVAIPTNEDGEIFSIELQAVLRPEGRLLRVVDPQTGLLYSNQNGNRILQVTGTSEVPVTL